MNISNVIQRSPEWYDLKKGRIGGTRFGQLISDRENRLMFDLLDETLNDHLFPDDFVTDEMQFGIDNEPRARELYSEQSGIQWQEVGAILSDLCPLHMASPDGIYQQAPDHTKVLEIKCTENGAIHLARFFNGLESSMWPQIINYFAVSDEVKEVHWISYCPYRPERQIVKRIINRDTIYKVDRKGNPITVRDMVIHGRTMIIEAEQQLSIMKAKFLF